MPVIWNLLNTYTFKKQIKVTFSSKKRICWKALHFLSCQLSYFLILLYLCTCSDCFSRQTNRKVHKKWWPADNTALCSYFRYIWQYPVRASIFNLNFPKIVVNEIAINFWLFRLSLKIQSCWFNHGRCSPKIPWFFEYHVF